MGTDGVGAIPTGTVTFLFTDVEGSTRLWEECPEQMQVALERHDLLMRLAIDNHRGHVFTTAGDSFAVAFQDHDAAVSAASSAQVALQRETWPPDASIRVRMGIHTGNARERDGDYFGPTLNLAARLMSAGHGGQVLCSASTHSLLSDEETCSLGIHRLKDLSDAQEIFELSADDIQFPPLRTLDRVKHNLPVAAGPLLGRDTASDDVVKLVEAKPLVTLVGVGGMGKTRLALAVAAELAERFDDGVWFCDLASVGESEAVIHVVAAALGARQRPGRSLVDSVAEFCRDREMLVLLDNCEHVLDDVAELVEAVITTAPRVRFLATSREGLGLRTEVTYQLTSLEVGRLSPAVELFVDSAARVDPTWVWSKLDQVAIERICGRLDGIPLAIELAASRTRSMTPVEIERRLDDAFRSLRGGRRSIERHRTLQAAIEWSYEALDDHERRLFDRLSVFAGSCDIDAIEAVCGDDDDEPIDVVEMLDALVSKSLVTTGRTERGTMRYRLLEPLRQFAEDRLSHSGQAATTRQRHLDHYTQWAENWEADVWGAGTDIKERLGAEFANLRSATYWAIQIADTDNALRLVAAMNTAQFGWDRLEVGDWGARALQLDGVDDHPLGPAAATTVASSRWWLSDRDGYSTYLDRAEAMTTYDPHAYIPSVTRAFFTTIILGDLDAAKEIYDRIKPTDAHERTILEHGRLQTSAHVEGSEFANAALVQLRNDAEATGSALVGVIANGAASMVHLRRGEFGAALSNARDAVNAALAIDAQLLAHLYLFTLGMAAAAEGDVRPRDLELMRAGLREQHESGQETDQWLLLIAAVASLGDSLLAARIQNGPQTSIWANSEVASILPAYFPDIAEHSDSVEERPILAELVNDVTAAIDHRLDDS